MKVQRDFILLVALALALAAGVGTSANAQTAVPAVRPADGPTPPTPVIPDFSGLWTHGTGFGFHPPLSGPGPVVNRSRLPNGASNFRQMVGDYPSPILQPQAAE